MVSKHIFDTDAFMDMPLSTQALYMHLLIRADDDGFVSNPKKISRMIGAQDDDMRVLITKRFIIPFESGVCVIKHWRIHNYIQKDRYNPTTYDEEMALLKVKDNGVYTMDTECIHDVSSLETQVRLGKVRLGKDSKETQESVLRFGEDQKVKLTKKDYDNLLTELGKETTESLIIELDQYISSKGKDPYKNHKATIKSWNRRKHGDQNKNRKSFAVIG